MSNEPTDTHVLVRPEVTAFVEEVRRLLADLDEETRDELTGGLEADLSDQVADGTPLGDPAAYAAELRSAAGLPERQRRLATLGHPGSVGAVLDRSRERFLAFVGRPRFAPAWDVAVALRPAWWVARAWAVVLVADRVTGPWEPNDVVPSLGHPAVTLAALVLAVLLSTLVGMGRLWPRSGPDRRPLPRVALLTGNVAAAVALVVCTVDTGYSDVDQARDNGYWDGYHDARFQTRAQAGMWVGGRPIDNLFAYDAQGRPIDRVQLFDERGEPIEIGPGTNDDGRGGNRTVGCPAYNGDVEVYNVFPLDQLQLRRGTCAAADDPTGATPDHPLASVPRVSRFPDEAVAARVPGTDRDRDEGAGRSR